MHHLSTPSANVGGKGWTTTSGAQRLLLSSSGTIWKVGDQTRISPRSAACKTNTLLLYYLPPPHTHMCKFLDLGIGLKNLKSCVKTLHGARLLITGESCGEMVPNTDAQGLILQLYTGITPDDGQGLGNGSGVGHTKPTLYSLYYLSSPLWLLKL